MSHVVGKHGDADPLLGRVVAGQYEIVRKLGEGGVGGVYAALHRGSGRRVALKVMLPEFTEGSGVPDTFLDEAQTVSLIGHENVIDIFYGRRGEDGHLFLAMEYLEGEDLGQALRREGQLDWRRARPILSQATAALHAVHDHGIVHRDIKPANIFLVNDGRRHDFVKILDFGIARVTTSRYQRPVREKATISVSGTPQYMAPEQSLARPADRRTDVYSLGCVMYHMITGSPPFAADTIIDLMAKHSYEPPEPPRVRRPDLDIPPAVESIILRAMEKPPDRRFQSARELGEAIARARFTTSISGSEGSGQFRLDDPVTRRR